MIEFLLSIVLIFAKSTETGLRPCKDKCYCRLNKAFAK